MKYKQYRIAQPYIDEQDKQAVLSVLSSGELSLGPKLTAFEQQFSRAIGTKYACSTSSGTAALHLAVKSLDIGDGDEVITTPISFVASTNCLLYERARPIFVDIEEETYNLDPRKLEAAITPKTRAILVVHIFGQTADMNPILSLAKKYNLGVIEDTCESILATYKKKTAGTFGDIATFAFYPNKQMTTGEGGMIVTNNRKLYNTCIELKNQGRQVGDKWLMHKQLGYNYRLDEMSAALGISQLKKLRWMIKERTKIATLYERALSGTSSITLPRIGAHRTHTWFVYVIRVHGGKRNMLMKKLVAFGIQTRPYLPSIHLQPYMRKTFGYRTGSYPVAEKVASQTLALPLYIGLTKQDINFICSKIKQIIKSF